MILNVGNGGNGGDKNGDGDYIQPEPGGNDKAVMALKAIRENYEVLALMQQQPSEKLKNEHNWLEVYCRSLAPHIDRDEYAQLAKQFAKLKLLDLKVFDFERWDKLKIFLENLPQEKEKEALKFLENKYDAFYQLLQIQLTYKYLPFIQDINKINNFSLFEYLPHVKGCRFKPGIGAFLYELTQL